MAITRYAGDRFTTNTSDTKPTGVLDGAYLIDTGNLTQYVRRTVGGTSQWSQLAGGGGGGGTPGGANTQVQFNNAGAFGGDADLTFTNGNRLNVNKLGISGNIYDSNNYIGEGGMVLTNEGTTGVNWKSIESVLSGVGGSGVANYVARWSDEDTLTSGTIYDDGDVGIGTANPGAKFHVFGTTATDLVILESSHPSLTNAPDVIFYRNSASPADSDELGVLKFRGRNDNSQDVNYALFEAEAVTIADGAEGGALNFYTYENGSSAKRVTITGSNVGIGTNSPSHRLQVLGPTTGGWNGLNLNVVISSSNTYANGHAGGIAFGGAYNSSETQTVLAGVWASRPNAGDGQYAGMVHIGAREHGTSNIEKVLNVSHASVGIGTNAPDNKLHIVGDNGDQLKLDNDGDAWTQLDFANNDTNKTFLALDHTNHIFVLGAQGGYSDLDYIAFRPDGVNDDMVIQRDGNVGIGTNAPATKLYVLENAANWAAIIKNSNAAGYGLSIDCTANTGTTVYALAVYTGAGTGLFVRNTGNVGIGTAQPVYALDIYKSVTGDWLSRLHNTATSGNSSGLLVRMDEPGSAGFAFATLVNGNYKFAVKPDGKVGIGEAAPDAILEIANNDSSSYRFGYGGTSDVYLDADDVYFRSDNGGANQITKKGGSLGIGVVNAEHKLHVAGDAIISGYLYDSTNSTGADGYVLTSKEDGPQWKLVEDVLSGVGGSGTANYVSKWVDSDTIGNSIIYDDGDLGISTNSPDAKLHVFDTTVSDLAIFETNNPNSANGPDVVLYRSSASPADADDLGRIAFRGRNDADQDINYANVIGEAIDVSDGNEDGALRFNTYLTGVSTETMVLRSANVGIGTNAPQSLLHLQGSIPTIILHDTNTAVSGHDYGKIQWHTSDTSMPGTDDIGAEIKATDDSNYGDRAAILFSTARNATSLTERMRIASNGNVGIGTDAPAYTLQVAGNIGVNEYIRHNGDSNTNIRFTEDDINFKVGGVNFLDFTEDTVSEMTINEEGANLDVRIEGDTDANLFFTDASTDKIGIGTNAPAGKLEIVGSNGTVTGTPDGDAEELVIRNNDRAGIQILSANNGYGSLIFGSASDINGANIFYAPTATLLTIGTQVAAGEIALRTANGAEAVRIDANGSVGIGTATPAVPLHITKSAVGDNEVPEVIRLSTLNSASPSWSTTDGLCIGAEMKKADGTTITKQPIKFRYDGGDMATTLEDGKVGIGTNSPAAKLDLRSSDSVVAYIIRPSASPTVHIGSATSAGAQLGYVHANDYAFYGHDAAYNAIVVKSDGKVGIGQVTPDARLDVRSASGSVGLTVGNTTGDTRLQITSTENSDVTFNVGDASAMGTSRAIIFEAGSSEKMRISPTGLVGIGTNAPSYTLQANGTNGGIIGVTRTTGNTTGVLGHLRFGNTDVDSDLANIEGVQDGATDSARLEFQTQATGGSATTHLTLKSDGVVDINSAKLKINGGSGTDGQVLTTDGAGGIAWETSPGAGSVDGSGTASYIPKWTDSDTIGNSALFDGGGNNVGIGTNNPQGQFQLHSTASAVQRLVLSNTNANLNPQQRIEFWESAATSTSTNAHAAIEYVGDGTYESSDGTLLIKGYGSSADLPIAGFNRNGNVYLGMSGTKRVGINTLTPVKDIDLKYSSNNSADLAGSGLAGGAAGNGILINNTASNVSSYANLDFRAHNADGRIAYRYDAANQGSFHFITDNDTAGFVNAMSIMADGHVGIGTDDPAYLLDVYETTSNIAIFRSTATNYARVIIRAGASGDAQLSFQESTTTKWTIGNDGGDSDKFKIVVGGGAFGTSPIVAIDTAGKVGVGSNAPAFNLDVTGTGHYTGLLNLNAGLYLARESDSIYGTYIKGGSHQFPASPAAYYTLGKYVMSTASYSYDTLTGHVVVGYGNPNTNNSFAKITFTVYFRDNNSLATGAPYVTWTYNVEGKFTFQSDPPFRVSKTQDVSGGAKTYELQFSVGASYGTAHWKVCYSNVSTTNAVTIYDYAATIGTAISDGRVTRQGYQIYPGSVGIGTATPAKLLTVKSATSPIIGLYSAYADSNARNWSIGTNNAAYGDFTISASAANGGDPTAIKLSILKEGSVGIGTNGPETKLHVEGSSYVSSSIKMERTSAAGTDEDAGLIFNTSSARTDGQRIGGIYFGQAGTSWGMIRGEMDGTTGGKIYFIAGSQTNQISNTATKTFEITSAFITSAVDIRPTVDSSYDLGASTLKWAELYVDKIKDASNSTGSANQVLSAGGSGGSLDWVSLSDISGVDGSGTANKVAKWTDSDTIGNSQITDNGTSVGINVSPNAANKLEVNGQARATTAMFGNSSVSNVAAKPIHIKYGGTAELRLEDSTSSNYVYDISADFTNGFRITDVTSSLVPFAIAKTTGSVGIGTDAPDSKLEIAGGGYNSSLKIKGSGADTGIQFEDSAGNTDGYIYANGGMIGFLDAGTHWMIQCKDDDYIKFLTNNGTEHMRIKSDGNVGIGTDDPKAPLHIFSNGSANTQETVLCLASNTSNRPSLQFSESQNAGFDQGMSIEYRGDFGAGAANGLTINGLGANATTSGAAIATFLSGGNVGIGTTNPTCRLQLDYGANPDPDGTDVDVLKIGSTVGSGYEEEFRIKWYSGAGDLAYIGGSHTDPTAGNDKAYLSFGTRTSDVVSERVRIDHDGNVGIGTTTPGGLLEVYGASGAVLSHVKSGSVISRLTANSTTSDGTVGTSSAHDFLIQRAGSTRMTFSGSSVVVNDSGENIDFRVEGDGDANLIRTDAANDRVGIGVAAPDHKLQVNGTVSFRPNGSANNQHYFTTGGANNVKYMQYNSAGTLTNQFATDNVSYITGGSVGIGTATPAAKLDVRGALGANGVAVVTSYFQNTTSGATSSAIYIGASSGVDWKIGKNVTGIAGNTNFSISDHANGRYLDINSSGSVGIGTVTPGQRLDIINGAIRISSSGETKIFFRETIAADTYADRWTIGNDDAINNAFVFSTGANFASPKLVILDGGSVGIGTNSPSNRLHIEGTTLSNASIRIEKTTTGINEDPGLILAAANNTDGYRIGSIFFQGGATSYAQIRAEMNGTAGAKIYFVAGSQTNPVSNSSTKTLELEDAIITAAAAFRPLTDSSYTLGQASLKWSELYVDKIKDVNNSTGSANQVLSAGGSGGSLDWISLSDISGVDGSGTANKVSKWIDTDTIGDSQITDNGTSVGINQGSPNAANKLEVSGTATCWRQLISAQAYTQAPVGVLTIQGPTNGGTTINSDVWGLVVGPQHTRSSTANTYYAGIAFNHLLNHGGSATYNNAPQAWIGTRLHDTSGSERDFLVFATKSGTGTTASDVPVERMCIDPADGFVGIGTTNPQVLLDVYTTDSDTARFESTSTSRSTVSIRSGSTGDAQVRFQNGAASKWSIGNDGGDSDKFKIAVGSGAFAASEAVIVDTSGNLSILGTLTEASSLALKENIEDFTPSLDIINKIRPVKYNKKKESKKEIGLIAEELAELFPELVDRDNEGNPSGVNYSRAVTVLLGGFKELYKEIEELKKRI